MAKFKPVVDADQVYGEGDWRPVLGAGPRKNDWKLHMIGKQSIDDKLRGVILPSFDFELDTEDKAFRASVGACWTNEPDARLPRHFQPNAWGVPIVMYPYLGERNEHWISPANRKNMLGNDSVDNDDVADAFDDLNKWVRRNKAYSDAQKDFFLKTKKLSDDPLIPGRTVRFFSLAECRDKDNPWHLAVVGYTSSSYSYLIEQMRWRHEDAVDPRDPDWPRYLLGDPTNPRNALMWHVDKVQLDPKDTHDTNVMCFTERREFLDENQETKVISQETLDKRFLMVDPANWNIPTYEEQVLHMIEHYAPEVTAEMIRNACGHRCRCEIPDRPKNRTISTGSGSSESGSSADSARNSRREAAAAATATRDDEPAPSRSMAPTSKPPMPEDTPPARTETRSAPPVRNQPAKADSSAEYFAGKAGEKPVKKSVATLQAMVDAGDADGVKIHLNGKWVTLEESGLVEFAPPFEDDAPPPFEDDAPPPFEDDAPPPFEDGPSADGSISRSEMLKRIFPDEEALEAMSAEQRAKAEKLVDEAYDATDCGRKQELPPELIDRMLELVG